jgi:hypothetical protein
MQCCCEQSGNGRDGGELWARWASACQCLEALPSVEYITSRRNLFGLCFRCDDVAASSCWGMVFDWRRADDLGCRTKGVSSVSLTGLLDGRTGELTAGETFPEKRRPAGPFQFFKGSPNPFVKDSPHGGRGNSPRSAMASVGVSMTANLYFESIKNQPEGHCHGQPCPPRYVTHFCRVNYLSLQLVSFHQHLFWCLFCLDFPFLSATTNDQRLSSRQDCETAEVFLGRYHISSTADTL